MHCKIYQLFLLITISLTSCKEAECCLTVYANRFVPSPLFLCCQISMQNVYSRCNFYPEILPCYYFCRENRKQRSQQSSETVFSFPWKSEEKQTLVSNKLLPLEELTQTSLPTHSYPQKQPASLTAKPEIHTMFSLLLRSLNRFTLHRLGFQSTFFYYRVHQHCICLSAPNKPIRK